jgi:hypothetical protein
MNWKVLFLLAIVVAAALLFYSHQSAQSAQSTRSAQSAQSKRGKKSVRFNTHVSIKRITGDKSERYNPDLKDCVKRNTLQAMSVGGMKALAQRDLSL